MHISSKKFPLLPSPISFILLILYLAIALWSSPIAAGPFLKIDRLDYKSEFPIIKAFITVRDIDNILLTGLNEENILVYEDGYRVNYVRIKNLSEKEGFLYLVFSIDSSKSISSKALNQIKRSANEIVNSTGPNDMIAIYRFDDDVVLQNSFSNNRVELLSKIKRIERHGKKTLLYNAIYDSIDLLNRVNALRKAVIVFTDGKDEGSSVEIDDVTNFARDTNIPIYFICIRPLEREKILSRISKLTGGSLLIAKNENIDKVYNTILRLTKSQYIVDYRSMLEADGKPHRIEVRLKYGAIRDREQREISIKKRLKLIHSPSIFEIILISLIFILVVCLILILIFILKRMNKAPLPSSEIGRFYADSPTYTKKYDEVKAQSEGNGDDERVYSKTWLVEKDGQDPGKRLPILTDEFTFGREDGNSIVIMDRSVSPIHAKIKMIKNSYYLFDMASDQGTYLNDSKLLRPKLLYDWDEIKIGRKTFIFRGSNIA